MKLLRFFKRSFPIVFIATFLFSFSSPISAATYYVDVANGLDTNTGLTEGDAWQTMGHAESVLGNTSGHTVYVSPGIYSENGLDTKAGVEWIAQNEEGDVIITSSNGGQVIRPRQTKTASFDGFILDATDCNYAIVFENNSANKTFTHITLKNFSLAGINFSNVRNITVDNSDFDASTGEAFWVNAGENITVQNSTITVANDERVFMTPGDASRDESYTYGAFEGDYHLLSNTITGFSSQAFFWVSNDGNFYINGNSISNIAQTNSILSVTSGEGVLSISNNTTTLPYKTSNETFFISSGTWDVDFSNNNFTFSATDQVFSVISIYGQTSPLVEGNTFDIASTDSSFRGSVIIKPETDVTNLPDSGGTLIVRNNTISQTEGAMIIGIGQDSSSSTQVGYIGGIIEGNTIYGPIYMNSEIASSNETHGVFYGQGKNAVIRKNIVYGSGFGIVIKGIGYAFDSGGVYGNVIVDSTSNGPLRIKGPSSVNVYNNTFFVPEGFTNDLISITGLGNDVAIDASFSGNVLVNDGDGMIYDISDLDYGADTDAYSYTLNDYASSDYNCFSYSNSLASFSRRLTDGASQTTTDYVFSSWQSQLMDTNGHNENNIFTDKDSDNYTLSSTSNCIDSAISISGYSTDVLGNPIYGSPDPGAYEYQPPYTMGSDEVDVEGNVRIYADGKFRNTQAPSGTTADLSVTPTEGFGTGDYSEWMNISITEWNNSGNYAKSWVESSDTIGSDSTVHTVGDLEANGRYILEVDDVQGADITSSDCTNGVCTANTSGEIVFTYTGGYSSHTFSITEYTEPATSSNSSSESTSTPSAPTCADRSPIGKPDLFQIDRIGNQAKLYFTPVNDHVESYHVIFGYYDGDERFGGINMGSQNENKGVQSITVDSLDPQTSYSFKVISVNGCATGEWSNWQKIDKIGNNKFKSFYRYLTSNLNSAFGNK